MNKIDFILLFDAVDANPNGDPDAGNMPRQDTETSHGIVTDVCLKRKIRNYVQLSRNNEPPYEIYVRENAILNRQQQRSYTALETAGKKPTPEEAKAWMCRNFYDIRAFGAVMSTGVNCGQVRGPVQLSFARSFDPVIPAEIAVTRCAVTKEEDATKERTMGRKYVIPYALYMVKGTVNPFFAAQTGFEESDLELLIESLIHMFDFDASAARPAGSMVVRKLILFRHSSQLGNAPAHKLYDALKIGKKTGVETPRCVADYDIHLDSDVIPEGITVEEIDS
ncbi:MAG: type I-C CRISPR-associated protein Cas7/Csd2 [Akkermansia sp.]|nr:type I-C CRISPR-associated protein Cas7/Csd2 [Akkermansia sp.]